MALIDIILVAMVAVFGAVGFWFGFLHTLGSLLGSFLGIYLAVRYYAPVAEYVIQVTGWGENWLRFVVFTLTFITINRLVGLVFWFLGKTLDIVRRLPILATLNRLLGFVFGVFEGVATLGFLLYFLERFPLSSRITDLLSASELMPYYIALVEVLIALFPLGVTTLRSSVDAVEGKIF